MRCDLQGSSVIENESTIHRRSSVLDEIMSRSNSKFGPDQFEITYGNEMDSPDINDLFFNK
mgnify:CR=1 FL=1